MLKPVSCILFTFFVSFPCLMPDPPVQTCMMITRYWADGTKDYACKGSCNVDSCTMGIHENGLAECKCGSADQNTDVCSGRFSTMQGVVCNASFVCPATVSGHVGQCEKNPDTVGFPQPPRTDYNYKATCRCP